MLHSDAIAKFRTELRGQVIEPGDREYEDARKVYNGMISRKPAADRAMRRRGRCHDRSPFRARATDAASRSAAAATTPADWASATTGWSSTSRRSATSTWIRLRETVRVGGGCTWGDVDHATHAFGLAVPAGIISTTGVGGLTLGGGIGHLTRQYGLTIDNLLAADMVLADGTFVVASAEENRRSVLGDSRRRRQFRRRHVVPVPGASGADGLRRPDALGAGSGRRRDEVVSRVHRCRRRRRSTGSSPS